MLIVRCQGADPNHGMVSVWVHADPPAAGICQGPCDAVPCRSHRWVLVLYDLYLSSVCRRLLASREARVAPRHVPRPLDWSGSYARLPNWGPPRSQAGPARADPARRRHPARQSANHYVSHARVAPCRASQEGSRSQGEQPVLVAPKFAKPWLSPSRHLYGMVPPDPRPGGPRRLPRIYH